MQMRPVMFVHRACSRSTIRKIGVGRHAPQRSFRMGQGVSFSRSEAVRAQRPDTVDASSHEPAFSVELLRASRSWRPAIFVLAGSIGAYALAADRTNAETIQWSKRIRGEGPLISWRTYPPTTGELVHAKKIATRDAFIVGLNAIKEKTSNWSRVLGTECQRLYIVLSNSYLAMPEGRRTCYTITAVNIGVFLCWKIPRLRGAMTRHFTHDPLSGKSYTILTSMFSHQNLWHLAFNSLALLSFGSAFDIVDSQRPDVVHMAHSSNQWHFMATYVGIGLFAGGLSHIIATRFRLPRLLRMLADPLKRQALKLGDIAIKPSLGASGGIYGIVAMTAFALPETNISLIFLPMLPFPITFGVAGMVTLDIIGILRGWQVFDHWAHLGGAIAGTVYYFYGPWEYVRAKLWPLRVP